MGKLELPMPELGKNMLEDSARDLEKRIRLQTPPSLRDSITVRPQRKGEESWLVIEYDDEAEQFVYIAIEYPAGSGRSETADPGKPS